MKSHAVWIATAIFINRTWCQMEEQYYRRAPAGLCSAYLREDWQAATKIICGGTCMNEESCLGFCYKEEEKICALYKHKFTFEGAFKYLHRTYSCHPNEKMDFNAGLSNCLVLGAALMTPLSAEENEIYNKIYHLFENDSTYVLGIGATDRYNEGNFYLFNGGENINYTNWAAFSPSNGGGEENCVMLRKDGKWNDIPCWSLVNHCCQYPGPQPCKNLPYGQGEENAGKCYEKIFP